LIALWILRGALSKFYTIDMWHLFTNYETWPNHFSKYVKKGCKVCL
jgi:hypothetical protein